MDNDVNEKYYIFCDESGNDAEHPVIGCVIVEKDVYNNLLKIIKPKYNNYEKENQKFEEIHFATFKSEVPLINFTLDIVNDVSNDICFYSLILNEKIDNNSKKDHYYNVLLNEMIKDLNIRKFQIEKIVVDKYKKQDKQKIGNFECHFVNSKHKISKLDFSYFLQICDCLIGPVRYIKNNKKNKSDTLNAFCGNIKTMFRLNELTSIKENWIVKDYKK